MRCVVDIQKVGLQRFFLASWLEALVIRPLHLSCRDWSLGLHEFFAAAGEDRVDRLRMQHRSFDKTLPYNPKRVLFRVIVRRKLAEPLAFQHIHGAVNVVVFRP